MDVREKLVELMKEVKYSVFPNSTDHYTFGVQHNDHIFRQVADHLIAHGVTVQELDGCEYCNDPHPARDCVLPDGVERMLVNYDDGTFLGKPLVYSRKIKFCPMCGRKLPQPPKGE